MDKPRVTEIQPRMLFYGPETCLNVMLGKILGKKASSEGAFLAISDFFSGQRANRRPRQRSRQKALF